MKMSISQLAGCGLMGVARSQKSSTLFNRLYGCERTVLLARRGRTHNKAEAREIDKEIEKFDLETKAMAGLCEIHDNLNKAQGRELLELETPTGNEILNLMGVI